MNVPRDEDYMKNNIRGLPVRNIACRRQFHTSAEGNL